MADPVVIENPQDKDRAFLRGLAATHPIIARFVRENPQAVVRRIESKEEGDFQIRIGTPDPSGTFSSGAPGSRFLEIRSGRGVEAVMTPPGNYLGSMLGGRVMTERDRAYQYSLEFTTGMLPKLDAAGKTTDPGPYTSASAYALFINNQVAASNLTRAQPVDRGVLPLDRVAVAAVRPTYAAIEGLVRTHFPTAAEGITPDNQVFPPAVRAPQHKL